MLDRFFLFLHKEPELGTTDAQTQEEMTWMVNLDTFERVMCMEIHSAKKDGCAGLKGLWVGMEMRCAEGCFLH